MKPKIVKCETNPEIQSLANMGQGFPICAGGNILAIHIIQETANKNAREASQPSGVVRLDIRARSQHL